MKRQALAGVVLAFWALAAVATPCAPAEPGPPQRVRLKAMLQALAIERGFKLEYWTADDPEVVRSGGSDFELMTTLAGQANLIVRYAKAGTGCVHDLKIDTVWVLPIGPANAPRPAPAAAAKPPDQATLDYMRAHGMPAPKAASSGGP